MGQCASCGADTYRKATQCRKCWMNQHGKVERICEVCGKTFTDIPSDVARGWGRFCSNQCQGVSNIATVNKTRRSPREYAKPPVRRGVENNKWVPDIPRVCEYCGKTFERKPWEFRRSEGHQYRFCSIECRGAYKAEYESGSNSPQWVGGPCTYRGRSWLAARKQVVARQNGKCADCGKSVGNSLPVHHIKPFRDFQSPEEANAQENLVGLCQSCHMKRENPKGLALKASGLPVS